MEGGRKQGGRRKEGVRRKEFNLRRVLRTTLYLFFSGLYFAGMDSHVLRPMITAFCLSASHKDLKDEHTASSLLTNLALPNSIFAVLVS